MRIHGLPLLLAAATFTVSCGEKNTADTSSTEPIEFSMEEKAAAQALSIGNDAGLEEGTSSFDRALQCRIAIQSLYARFEDIGSLEDDQESAIREVAAHFDKQVTTLGRAAGFSATEIDQKSHEAQEEIEASGREGTTAVACLQALRGN